jgi:hypothetical protein
VLRLQQLFLNDKLSPKEDEKNQIQKDLSLSFLERDKKLTK